MYGAWIVVDLCLNPYSNGIWIELGTYRLRHSVHSGLNPYSNGIWIELRGGTDGGLGVLVLILILMEYG